MYRGTSLTRKRPPLGPYRRPVRRVLGGSWGNWGFLMGRYPCIQRAHRPIHFTFHISQLNNLNIQNHPIPYATRHPPTLLLPAHPRFPQPPHPPCSERDLDGLTQPPQQSHPLFPRNEPLHWKANRDPRAECFLCSLFYGRACRWAMLGSVKT